MSSIVLIIVITTINRHKTSNFREKRPFLLLFLHHHRFNINIVRFPNPLAPDTCQLGNPTTLSSPSITKQWCVQTPFQLGEYLKSIIWILSSTRPAVTLDTANSSWVISIYFSLTRFSQLRWPNILFIYVRSFLKGTKINLVTLYKNFFNHHLAIYNFSNIVNVDEIDLTFGLVPWAKLEETKTKEFWILSWFKIFPLNNFIFYPSLGSFWWIWK